MPDIAHIWTSYNPYQAPGTTGWSWQVGENEHYWGYSVRPFQANSDFEVVRQWTTSNNDMQFFENFVVTTNSGGLVRFSALRAVGT